LTDDRDFGTGGTGTPEGDRNKYHLLSNGEFDYDQVEVGSIEPTDPVWVWPSPPSLSADVSDGFDTRYLLSFGPFNIDPGQVLPISFAYFAGIDFHTVEDNLENLPDRPDLYKANLNFDSLGLNSTWSSWVYDNPGIDTDGDGYFGKSRICTTLADTGAGGIDVVASDTVFYEGDGVPDFRGASPPPAPIVMVDASVGDLKVRWNGVLSETTRDVFSREIDFEGYRVWFSRDDRSFSYSLAQSYDIEDYNKWVFDRTQRPPSFRLLESPFTLGDLRCLYADSCNDLSWDPRDFDQSNPYFLSGTDSVFYFVPQDFNASELGVTTGIKKVYGDTISFPSTLIADSAQPHELTPEGHLKYFEYEYTITNLLPTVQYYVAVTAFDYGSPTSGLPSLETSVTTNAISVYALSDLDAIEEQDLKVYTYPNPYRADGGYFESTFEGRTKESRDQSEERRHRIHFANLPAVCTIRIYTIDGDLVRELIHDTAESDPEANHETWDLITRNTQAVVSGLYYWTVEDSEGKVQMGKLAIIM
jgi:hypothetical protein